MTELPPPLPPRSRGSIALLEESCTSCMLCARECPDWCITIDSHTEPIIPVDAVGAAATAAAGARVRTRNVLDGFAIDYALCMYCGICVDVCPFDALFWSPELVRAGFDIRDLDYERDRLGALLPGVPPPPAVDPGAEEPKELAVARRQVR